MDERWFIGLHKAALWEEAKGKLRALVSVSGQIPGNKAHESNWEDASKAVEDFIKSFEEDGLHE